MKELKGRLNTQQEEQLHSACQCDSHFFTNMKPVNHTFFTESYFFFFDLRNCEKKNFFHIAFLANQRMSTDHLGRIILTTNDGFEEEMKIEILDDPTKHENISEIGEKRKFMDSLE